MYLTFDFPRDDTPTEQLEKLINRINTFLRKRVNVPKHYRYFSTRILAPKSRDFSSLEDSLTKIQHPTDYLLVFQFFDDNVNEVGNQRLIVNLGDDSNYVEKFRNDISVLSYLASFPLSSVKFQLSPESLSILIGFDDNNSKLINVIVHIEYVIPGKEIPHRYYKPDWYDDGKKD